MDNLANFYTEEEKIQILQNLGYTIYRVSHIEENHYTGDKEVLEFKLASKTFTESEIDEMLEKYTRHELLTRFGIYSIFKNEIKDRLNSLLLPHT
jgi:hypothetical protein